jgi:hypothetical protein
LEKRAEQVLPGSEGVGGQGGEMAQAMYTHMNKCINNKKRTGYSNILQFFKWVIQQHVFHSLIFKITWREIW